MMAFPIASVEFAFKRSRIELPSVLERSLYLLGLVSETMGLCRVNFDAEYTHERLKSHELERLCAIGVEFSETYQAGRPGDDEYLHLLGNCLVNSNLFGLNIVLGNPKYGCTPSIDALDRKASLICVKYGCMDSRLKLGAEGESYGKEVIRICGKLNAAAYILYTPRMLRLIEASKDLNVNATVYTPIRISETRSKALSEIMELGMDYLARRGIGRDSIALRASEYIVYGSPVDVASKMRELIALGVNKFVLSPLYYTPTDLARQLHYIAKHITY